MAQKTKPILLLLLVAMICLVSCGRKGKQVLRVGTNPEYPPFSYKMGEQLTGVDAEIARKIAEKMGMKYQLTAMDFESLLPSLALDKIDLAISSITITNERWQSVDFTVPYYTTNQVIIAKSDSPIQIKSFADLGKYTIGSLEGTTGCKYLDENLVDKDLMPKDKLKLYSTNIEANSEMLNGIIDFVIIDETAANGYAKLKPIKSAFVIPTNENYGIAMQKGKAINSRINKALTELIASGEIKHIIAGYVR